MPQNGTPTTWYASLRPLKALFFGTLQNANATSFNNTVFGKSEVGPWKTSGQTLWRNSQSWKDNITLHNKAMLRLRNTDTPKIRNTLGIVYHSTILFSIYRQKPKHKSHKTSVIEKLESVRTMTSSYGGICQEETSLSKNPINFSFLPCHIL